MQVAPPTIEHLISLGVVTFDVNCANLGCAHCATLHFEVLAIDVATPFPFIERVRRFVCTRCGSRVVTLRPDFRHFQPKAPVT
jgi:hypothetical protein